MLVATLAMAINSQLSRMATPELHRQAAVGKQYVPRGVGGCVGCQEDRYAAKFLSLGKAVEGYLPLNGPVKLVVGTYTLGHRRCRDGRDGVDRDVVPSQLTGGRLGQCDHASLCCCVVDLAYRAADAGARSHIDDPSRSLGNHGSSGRAHPEEHRREVDLEDVSPSVVFEVP